MLGFLFPRLTPTASGTALFDALTQAMRQPHWYLEGGIPDDLDGRFGVLATLLALALVRLERDGDAGDALSVALTERFIEVMESEHRELGLGDPSLGKKVRRLVGALAKRVALWREADAGEPTWRDATNESLYAGKALPESGVDHSAAQLRAMWDRLRAIDLAALAEGHVG